MPQPPGARRAGWGPRTKRRQVIRLALIGIYFGWALATTWVAPAAAQEPPHPAPATLPVTVAETFEPRDLFPLQRGIILDYESDGGDVLRRTVERDTLVGATAYVVVADTVWGRAGTVTASRYVARYDAVTARVVVWDGDEERPSSALLPCPLAAAEVVECLGDTSAERRHVTESVGELDLAPGREVLTRTYASEAGFGVLVLAEGVGPVLIADVNGVYTLRYARLGARTLGEPARPVRPLAVAPAAPLARRLRVWPNPAAGPVTLRYEGAGSGPAVAEVFDALGRRVRVVPLRGGDAREVTVDLGLSPGAYVVRVRGAGGGVVARFVRL